MKLPYIGTILFWASGCLLFIAGSDFSNAGWLFISLGCTMFGYWMRMETEKKAISNRRTA